MLKEVLVVEGKMDIVAVRRAMDADCIITDGFHFSNNAIKNIKAAYEKRGIIILTDPDQAGERIRKYLTKKFPKAKHAYIPKTDATLADDIGVENASPESIRKAISKVRTVEIKPQKIFTESEMIRLGLSGSEKSSEFRDKIGAELGIGYGNVKTFVRRLNNYGITREEFQEAYEKFSF